MDKESVTSRASYASLQMSVENGDFKSGLLLRRGFPGMYLFARGLGRAIRQVNAAGRVTFAEKNDESQQNLIRNRDLFLAQKIKVCMAAGARIDDGGKVPRKIVGVAIVSQRKCKGDLQCDLGCPDEVAVSPRLTVNRDITARSNCI